ncbi:MAG: PPC domain-containing DNA-binding protein [Candidatus Saccharibacteria bacterium]|nr:PPC domain-containing DNA-binding protein [Candidatus Saccharibacteria bacterium]
MKYQHDGYNWLVRLEKGEKLVASLTELVAKENIQAAWISGLGAALQSELGFYDLKSREYNFKTIDKTLEITSLQGNVSRSGSEPKLHIHGSFSDENMRVFGGHVKELTVGGTCEIFLHRWFKDELTRSHDDTVGLPLLDL